VGAERADEVVLCSDERFLCDASIIIHKKVRQKLIASAGRCVFVYRISGYKNFLMRMSVRSFLFALEAVKAERAYFL